MMLGSLIDSWSQTRYVEVDAARLLIILNQFAVAVDDTIRQLQCFPKHVVTRYFTPEYKLQKLDFLVRYPSYFVYELIELYRTETTLSRDRNEIIKLVRLVLNDKEPEQRTDLYRKFLRGAYARLDAVESWWYSRGLVYRGTELRGGARPQKYYFLTEKVEQGVANLVSNVSHAAWYHDRISLLYKYFGEFSADQLRNRQYSHAPYREAQLSEEISDLPFTEIITHFEQVFGEPLGVDFE